MATFVPTQHLQTYKALSPARPELSAKGKSVLVTGGGYGIGRSIAESFAAAGASRVGISGRTEARLQSAIAELKQAYPKTGFSYFAADITDEPAVKAMFQAFGAPDVLINNAGYLSKPGPIKTADLKEWWQGFEINVLGTAIVTQQFLRAKAKGKEAVVITVNTIGAHLGTMVPNLSGYSGSKAASLRMIECFQAENPEVRFVSVHPGAVATDMATKSELTGMDFTDAELSADFILWTASPEADFLKGRFAWVNWDIAELKAKKSEILEKNLLKYTLGGF
ncbi:related to peroxisomal short-chain alcohol dehydrogenase [Phialocephala subalpina]|uniref:Related to peroxisomal short-chain alcohol dehydrogenase n=1 Tax=Phialocephala subalpina TaxID=576137 RepID=A0A1L7WCZ6_9HELO|nr:related to peroxisomal short-chain alcohol dehydrogenase [Phialocephala subalpina]